MVESNADAMRDLERPLVPAAGREAFTGLYDVVMALSMRERAWRPQLTALVVDGLGDGGRVVDAGCGTGTQAIAIAAVRRDAEVVGVDVDAEVLERASRKPGGERLRLLRGRLDALPLEDRSADRVTMSLVLHHLQWEEKVAALSEAARILSPEGVLHVVDWGRPTGLVPRVGFSALRLLDGLSNTRDHGSGRWLEAFSMVGLTDPQVVRRLSTVWGTLEHRVCEVAEGFPRGG